MIAYISSGVLVAISEPSRTNVSITLASLSAPRTAARIFSMIGRDSGGVEAAAGDAGKP